MTPQDPAAPVDAELEACLSLCNAALDLPDREVDSALGRAIAALLDSPRGELLATPPIDDDGIAAAATHDGTSFGWLAVAGRRGGYGDGERAVLAAIARFVGWLLYSRREQRAAMLTAQEHAARLRLHAQIFELADEALVIADASHTIVSANPAFCRMVGWRADELLGKPLTMFHCARHDLDFYVAMSATVRRNERWKGEVWTRRKDGEIFPTQAMFGGVRDATTGRVSHVFFIATDVTERKRAESSIHRMAYYDALTNLPNRILFLRLLDQALRESRRRETRGAVLFIDLNRFKPINDTLGHAVGDQVLQEVADRLRNSLRGADVVARLGGDEFVVGLFEIDDDNAIDFVANKLLAALQPPVIVAGRELAVGGAIGISVWPDDGDDTETLLRLADIAMYRAKETGPDTYVRFSRDMDQVAIERLSLEASLRRAIERGELLLHYQPKLSLKTGRIVGAEALVRWKRGDRMVPPGEFIPVAEESGLIVQISHWVLEEVCSQARRWLDAGMPELRIAVNLSARDFSPTLPQRIMSVLSGQNLPPQWLELEITEGMLMNRTEAVIAMMDELAQAGLRLALDDFGTGYSSLSYLKRFPIHTLKIDRSFVINIPQDGNDCAIAGAIAGMAAKLGHNVVAEGVESGAQADFLRESGCDEIQGYYFSPPLPAERFEALVRENSAVPPQRPRTAEGDPPQAGAQRQGAGCVVATGADAASTTVPPRL